MKELYVLISPVLWSIKNDLMRVNWAFYRKLFFYGGLSGTFIFLLTNLLHFGMTKLQELSPEVFGFLLLKGYALVFMFFFFIQIINGLVISLNTFYQSRDLEILFTSPVDRTALFFSRLLDTHIKTSWMLVIFGIPLLASLGLLFHSNLIFYGYSLILFMGFSIIPVNIGIGLTILLSSIFHVKRMKKLLYSAGGILSIILIILIRFFRPERFVNPELFANLTLFIAEMKTPAFFLMPNRWLSEAIFSFLNQSLNLNTLLFISILLLTSYTTTVMLLAAFKRYHFRGWALLHEGGTIVRRHEKVRAIHSRQFSKWLRDSTPGRPLSGIIDMQSRMFIRKDLLYQIRDEKNLQQISILLSLIIIYLFSISALPLNWAYYAVQLKYIISFFNLGLILIIIASLCSRLIYPAVISEGLFVWIVKTSPVTSKKYCWTKFFVFFIPILIVAQLLTISSSLLIGIEKVFLLLEIITTALVCSSLTGMAIAFGVFRMKRVMADTLQEQLSTGSTAYMLASVFLILFTLALEIVPIFLYFLKETKQFIFTQKAWLLVGTVICVLLLMNSLITIISMQLCTKKIDKIEAA